MRRTSRYLIVGIGVGLVLAPAIFQMFTRAPLGGQMINEFRPYMSAGVVARFDGYLDEIGAARAEVGDSARSDLVERLQITDQEFSSRFPQLTSFDARWAAIDAEMRSLLEDIESNLENFDAVASLPPFPLFPWFFVAPGLMTAAAGVWWLRKGQHSGSRWFVVAVGIGLIAAPGIFQMFSRAPRGAQMIDELRPLMTTRKVTSIQLHFLSIGGAEAELREGLKPQIQEKLSLSDEAFAQQFPSSARFIADWPKMASQMAPMVGAMSDNIDNFQAVDALPPFDLFPWFFVAPGVLLVALGLVTSPLLSTRSGLSSDASAITAANHEALK